MTYLRSVCCNQWSIFKAFHLDSGNIQWIFMRNNNMHCNMNQPRRRCRLRWERKKFLFANRLRTMLRLSQAVRRGVHTWKGGFYVRCKMCQAQRLNSRSDNGMSQVLRTSRRGADGAIVSQKSFIAIVNKSKWSSEIKAVSPTHFAINSAAIYSVPVWEMLWWQWMIPS